jgi:5-methylthioadenosine/S-adenosylhomocysteine deaminase
MLKSSAVNHSKVNDMSQPSPDRKPNAVRRRLFLQAGAAATVVAGLGATRSEARAADGSQRSGVKGRLPPKGEFVFRGGHVLSMDRNLGDLPVADVHVKGGSIVAVGKDLRLPGVFAIDARDTIVMPGFVDAHSHLWNAFLRGSIRGDDPRRGYFPVSNFAAPLCTPEDAYNSVRFGVAQELLSGVTTINNYSHNTRSRHHADAEIRAMLETGVRGRFSYGPAGRSGPIDMVDVARVQAQFGKASPRLTLGVNLLNPPPGGPIDTFAGELGAARALGLPISLHFSNPWTGLYQQMQAAGLFGPDILAIHCQGFDAAERQILVANRVKLSMSPVIEIPYSTVRDGYIQFDELEQLGAQLSLSIDATSASANADFFNVMRALQFSHKQRADTKIKLLPRRLVELATIDGARALGLDDRVGSLIPGKRADIIMVRKTDINMVPVFDPYFSLVYSGLPQNVDTVVVDGDVLVSNGEFTALDVDAVVEAATASALRVEAEVSRALS